MKLNFNSVCSRLLICSLMLVIGLGIGIVADLVIEIFIFNVSIFVMPAVITDTGLNRYIKGGLFVTVFVGGLLTIFYYEGIKRIMYLYLITWVMILGKLMYTHYKNRKIT